MMMIINVNGHDNCYAVLSEFGLEDFGGGSYLSVKVTVTLSLVHCEKAIIEK